MNTSKLLLQWRLFYFQYRSFFTPVGIIVVCVLLFIFAIIPQIEEFFSTEGQLASNQEQLRVLRDNFQQITGFNNQQLDFDYATVVSALPTEKDGVSILNSLSHAASDTNVSLRDYNFTIGTITPLTGEPPLEILLSVGGDMTSLQKFIHEIDNSLPLASVTSIDAEGSTSASLNVVFYTKTSLKPNIDPNQPIKLLTKQDLNMIDKLAAWQNNTDISQ